MKIIVLSILVFTHVDEKTFLHMDESRTLCAGFTQDGTHSLSRQRDLGQWVIPPPDWDKFCKLRVIRLVD